jgi:type 1 glutamine amidotransferase
MLPSYPHSVALGICSLGVASFAAFAAPSSSGENREGASSVPPSQATQAPTPPPTGVDDLPKSGETLPEKAQPGVIRALLIGGGSSHDFERYFHKADAATLQEGGKILTAYTSNAKEAVDLMQSADVIVISANHKSFGTPEFQNPLNAFADAGHGIVVVHAGAWYNWAPVTGYNHRFVGGGAKGHGKGEFTVFNKQSKHPVMEGVPADFKITDEHYRVILEPDAAVEVLAETEPETQTKLPYPSVWMVKDSKTRIIGIGLGHADEAHTNPAFRTLLKNAVHWTAGR